MMQLYKYSDYLGLEYFDNPTIILSIPSTLNDPFESNLSEDIIKHLLKKFKDKTLLEQQIKNTFTEYLELTGIVSLSETSRNLLMWSHYAKHHKGMCIGIAKDFLNHKSNLQYKFAKDFKITSSAEPKKVNYDNKRFEENEHEELDPKQLINGEAIDNYLHKHLMIKGDEWIYEKEHRSIIPLSFSDGVKDINLTANHKIKSLLEVMAKLNEVDTYKDSGTYFFKKQKKAVDFATLACNYRYDKANGIIFLLKIKPEHILTLHFGHRFDDQEINKIITKISAPEHKLNHVKVFKKKISNTRFELEEEQLYPPKK
ncbi:DUF2971 domain-containing protein [Aeromonas hydrophila]